MKKSAVKVCPGCSRHCTAGSVRCKYGHKYFAKLNASAPETAPSKKDKTTSKPRKWEKNVLPGGLLWKLLFTGRSIKRSLRKGGATEAQILAALTEAEQAALTDILEKIRPVRADA